MFSNKSPGPRRRRLTLLTAAAVLVLCVTSAVVIRAQSAGAGAGASLPYHGYLELAGTPVEGKRYVTFTLYNGDGSATSWTESQVVTVVGGHFTALLGARTSIDGVLKTGVPPLSLGLTVQEVDSGDQPTGTPVALTGRQLLGSTPYARRGAPGTSFAADLDITTSGGRIYDRSGVVTPVGALLAFAGSAAPQGWLLCDGKVVSSTAYAELYAAIGDLWGDGGDGAGPLFTIPDLRGRTAIGAGQGTGLTTRNLAQSVGEETHTLTTNEMPAHSHTLPLQHSNTNDGAGSGNRVLSGGASFESTSAGGGQPHNNMQPSVAVNYIIKY